MSNKIDKKVQEQNLVEEWNSKFKKAMIHKSKRTSDWHDFWDAYNGDYFRRKRKPDYKSDQVSNFIFSTIEAIRPIMIDGEPSFIVRPKNEAGLATYEKVQKAFDHEFDREDMAIKIARQTLTKLVIGTCIWYLPWDGNSETSEDGEIRAVEVNPFNIFPDPLANSIDDAEYIIYATYKHVNELKKLYSQKANLLEGSNVKYEELITNEELTQSVDNQVLVLEIWCRDYTTIETEEEDEEDGKKYKVTKPKYKNGRVITVAPDLNVLLEDKENPYDDGKFPFILDKCYDVPYEFWGEGEVKQLLSPQEYINDLNNQIIDNAKLTANMPWIVDKNAGIPMKSLTNRPGLVIRKNPNSNITREQPPSMPNYVNNKVEELKQDMETISGMHDVTQGRRPTGIQAGNAIMALQEAGQARVRIKIKLMEKNLTEVAKMWYSRMRQFWKFDRWVRVESTNPDIKFMFEEIKQEDLVEDFDITIVSGSTMQKNRAGMLELLIRLAQTTAEDGVPMIDRKTVLEYVDIRDRDKVDAKLSAMAEQYNINEEVQQQVGMMGEEMGMMSEQNNGVTQEILTILEDLSTSIEQLGQEVDEIKLEIGNSSGDLEDSREEQLSEIPMEDEISDEELLAMIDSLSEDELMELAMTRPDLLEYIENNLLMDSQGGNM